MVSAVKLSEHLIADARVMSHALNRSLSGQIEYWAKIGKIAEENPDLNYETIKNLLIAQQEVKNNQLTTYTFDQKLP